METHYHVQTAVRLPASVLDDVDRLAEELSAGGLRHTRAAVLRMLIVRGLEVVRETRPARRTR